MPGPRVSSTSYLHIVCLCTHLVTDFRQTDGPVDERPDTGCLGDPTGDPLVLGGDVSNRGNKMSTRLKFTRTDLGGDCSVRIGKRSNTYSVPGRVQDGHVFLEF